MLKKNIKQVKTGLPGVAWVKLDPRRVAGQLKMKARR